MKPRLKILIAEWIPSLNKGELAILEGMIETFKEIGDVETSIFSFSPMDDRKRYPSNVKIIDVKNDLNLKNIGYSNNLFNDIKNFTQSLIQHFLFLTIVFFVGNRFKYFLNKKIWKSYYETDVIIICHDSVDIVRGFGLPYYPVYVTILAYFLRKPLVIYGNGTSGLGGKLWQFLARFLLSNSQLVTIRDECSFKIFSNLFSGAKNVFLTADPAVLLKPISQEAAKKILTKEKIQLNKLLIGAIITHNIILKTFKDAKRNNNDFAKTISEYANFFDSLIEKYDAHIIFLPHCIENYDNKDDRIVSSLIFNSMRNKFNVTVITNEYTSQELKGLLGQLNFLISSRIHASIGALSMFTPSLTLTSRYDSRSYGLIGKMLHQRNWIIEVEQLDMTNFFLKFQELFSSNDKIRSTLPLIIRATREKAFDNGRLLKSIIEKYCPIK